MPSNGLPQERTILAWRRSSLTFVGVGLLVVRMAVVQGPPVAVVIGTAGLVNAVAIMMAILPRRRWTRPSPVDPAIYVIRDGRLPAMTALMAVLLGLAIVVLASGAFD